jgi:hypothetical protein
MQKVVIVPFGPTSTSAAKIFAHFGHTPLRGGKYTNAQLGHLLPTNLPFMRPAK